MKLTSEQHHKLWGNGGPYSEVNLIIQNRVLDDRVSRRFVEVEVVLNPLTYEIVAKNLEHFKNDEPVLRLINHASDRGLYGYVVSAFRKQYSDESVMREAKKQAEFSNEVVIRLHKFVMDLLEIDR